MIPTDPSQSDVYISEKNLKGALNNDIVAVDVTYSKNGKPEGKVVQIERDKIERISTKEEKVRQLLELLHIYQVSPIHLVDVLGEYVDNYVCDFNF